jgi:hypothetical protein
MGYSNYAGEGRGCGIADEELTVEARSRGRLTWV